jgi:hypothetical protein
MLVVKEAIAEFYYELFKLTRDAQGDIHSCMNYLNKAIGASPTDNWVYHYEMSLFIKQVGNSH